IFFSFVGFEDLVKMAEETESPRTTLPRAIVVSAIVVLLLYLLVAISAVAVRSPEKLAADAGPLAAVMGELVGSAGGTALAAVALFATSKTILSNIFGTSRLLFDIARDTDAAFLKRLTRIVPRFGTPVLAIGVVTVVAIGFGMIGDLSAVASISNLCVLTVFTMVNIGLVVWRCRHPDADPAPFHLHLRIGRVPVLPVLGAAGTLVMIGFNIGNLVAGIGS
ncbi:MAG: amino acid permease, partial [Verrucomicrobiae bacterium]|nr:amino acid permease [Verrucomicrobiae bacterium]